MDRVDIKVGFSCNNRCMFCVQGNKRDHHQPRTVEELRERMLEGRREGSRAMVVTGGEPTMREDLVEIVRMARAMGYLDIQIQTNGRRFAYLDYCKALIGAGATEFSPALHGSTEEIHDHLTRAPGSWKQTTRGIDNLVGLGQRVITNSVITRANQSDLPALAALLIESGVLQFQLAFVHILGTAAEECEAVVPRKSEVMPFVREALDLGRERGIPCYTEAIPFCLMEGYERHVAEAIIPSTKVFDAEVVIDDYGEYRRSIGKAKRPECRSCRYDRSCEGPWKEYPELYGWDEFEPLQDG